LSWKEVCGRARGSTNTLAVDHVWLFCQFSRPFIKKLQRLQEKPFSEKTNLLFENPLWQEKFKIVAKNQDGVKCNFFSQNVEYWPKENFQSFEF
jgi:hypothetical protein